MIFPKKRPKIGFFSKLYSIENNFRKVLLFGIFFAFPKEKKNLKKTGKKLAFLRFWPFPKENANFGHFCGYFPKLYNKENNSRKVQNFCKILKNRKNT